MTTKAFEENRVAIVNGSGNVINVVVAATAAWVQSILCGPGETAHDVKGLPVSNGWKRDTDFYCENPDGSQLRLVRENGLPVLGATGWCKVEVTTPE